MWFYFASLYILMECIESVNVKDDNDGPFPSSPHSLFWVESKCETFVKGN